MLKFRLVTYLLISKGWNNLRNIVNDLCSQLVCTVLSQLNVVLQPLKS